ncbi:MAG: DUF1559 domain-containing protein [Pirellulaceae bacterium]
MTTPLAYFSERLSKSRREGKTVVIVIVILAVCFFVMVVCGGVLVALLLPAVQQARHAARRMQSSNNMKMIGLALHNYHDTYGTFPPAYIPDENGKPMHSWRVLISPFLDDGFQFSQYDFDKPWDHADNMAVTQQMPSVYNSPILDSAETTQGMTPYVAVSGPETVLGQAEGSQFRSIVDGTSHTIIAMENFSRPVFWAEPTDISPDQIMANFTRIMDSATPGPQVLMADGSVMTVSSSTSPQAFEGGLYINDGEGFSP